MQPPCPCTATASISQAPWHVWAKGGGERNGGEWPVSPAPRSPPHLVSLAPCARQDSPLQTHTYYVEAASDALHAWLQGQCCVSDVSWSPPTRLTEAGEAGATATRLGSGGCSVRCPPALFSSSVTSPRPGYSHTTALSSDGCTLVDVMSNAFTPFSAAIHNLADQGASPVPFFQQKGELGPGLASWTGLGFCLALYLTLSWGFHFPSKQRWPATVRRNCSASGHPTVS